LKRWRTHGGGGASNSEARRKVLEWQIVEVVRFFFRESMLLKRTKADCADDHKDV
jgi:hypothetical protein